MPISLKSNRNYSSAAIKEDLTDKAQIMINKLNLCCKIATYIT